MPRFSSGGGGATSGSSGNNKKCKRSNSNRYIGVVIDRRSDFAKASLAPQDSTELSSYASSRGLNSNNKSNGQSMNKDNTDRNSSFENSSSNMNVNGASTLGGGENGDSDDRDVPNSSCSGKGSDPTEENQLARRGEGAESKSAASMDLPDGGGAVGDVEGSGNDKGGTNGLKKDGALLVADGAGGREDGGEDAGGDCGGEIDDGNDLYLSLGGGHRVRYGADSEDEPCIDRALHKWKRLRFRCGKLINHPDVQMVIVTMIAINAILMGVATYPFVRENPVAEDSLEMIDMVFLVIFTIELILQFIYHGWRLFTDGWLVFDVVIILMSWFFSDLQIIRAFRIFRALRLITRIKVMKNLVLALFAVMPRMFAIGLLLSLITYIFAVMYTQLFKDMYENGQTTLDFFGRLDLTFFTLFQIMTLDSWADVARQVMKVYSWAWFPFLVFVITTGFVVVNLIIAVICDAISALHDDEKAKLHGHYDAPNEDEEDEMKFLGLDKDKGKKDKGGGEGVSKKKGKSSGQGDEDKTGKNPELEIVFDQEQGHSDGKKIRRESGSGAGEEVVDNEGSSSMEIESTGTRKKKVAIEDQLEALEKHVDHLSKLQERTLQTLALLNQRIAEEVGSDDDEEYGFDEGGIIDQPEPRTQFPLHGLASS